MDWDSHRYLEAFFAVPMMGAVLQTVNVRLSPEQILYTLNYARADVLLDRLKRRRPALAAALQALYHLVGAGLMAVILWAAWAPLVESIRIQEYVGAVGDFTAPVWPVRLIMLVGICATLATFLLLAWLDLRRALSLQERGR